MTNIFYHNTGQTSLEIALGIGLAIILVVAVISSWNWFNKTMVERLENYNASRLAAVHDIGSDQFGMNATYSKPILDIFSLDASINDAPLGIPAEGLAENYPLCYDNLNASLAVVNQTQTEIQILDQEMANITVDIINLKNVLGSDVDVLRNCWTGPDTKLFNVWIYGQDHMQEFFDNNFTVIGTQLGVRIAEEGAAGCGISFWTDGSLVNVVDQYINPGIALEAEGAQKAADRNAKQSAADTLEGQAWQDFYDCIGQQQPQDACRQQCNHFLEDSERLNSEAQAASASGNFGQAQDLLEQANQASDNFDTCDHDCRMQDPCYVNCYNLYGAQADQAKREGRMEDYLILEQQFEDCLRGC